MHVERDGDRDKYIYIYIYIYIYGGGEIVIFGLVGPKSNLYTLFCGFCTRRREEGGITISVYVRGATGLF